MCRENERLALGPAQEPAGYGATKPPRLAYQGTNTPSTAKSVFGDVLASPSAPPSKTLAWPNSMTVRRISRIVPGSTASAVVETEHVEPTFTSVVAAQGTVAGKP